MARRLFAALSPNGSLVHLSDRHGKTACSSQVIASYRVQARITCRACARRHPERAWRLRALPHVVGIDHGPLYAALRRALETGETKLPRVRVSYWPRLAGARDLSDQRLRQP